MYFLDPDSGPRRRGRLRGRVEHEARQLARDTRSAARDLAHRAHGIEARAEQLLRYEGKPEDDVLEARVRQALGHACSHPRALEVRCRGGCVELRGDVLRRDLRPVRAALKKVSGVREVIEDLRVHEEPGVVPGLQEPQGTTAKGRRSWTPARQLVTACGGLGLTGVGLLRGGLVGSVGALAGLGLFGKSLYERSRSRRPGGYPVTVRKAIHVAAPVDEVFAFWNRPERFPLFMEHVREVQPLGDGRYHWRVTGPGGLHEWTAEVTRVVPNREIRWRSLPGSSVPNEGCVKFQSDDRGTLIDVRLDYKPPAGTIGHGLAVLLGSDPKKQMDDDLLRFKSLVENGRATGHEGPVSRQEVAFGWGGTEPTGPRH
jgi:uncharacterized membrane protein